MPGFLSLADPFFAVAVAAAMVAAHSPPSDTHEGKRLRLEAERRELQATIEDPVPMQNQGEATLARLSVERGWKQCVENEAVALAKTSERPARLLAEAALVSCREWEILLRLALDNGAYPYFNRHVSKDDMVAREELESRDGALRRISMWRAGSLASTPFGDDERSGIEGTRQAVPPRPVPPTPPSEKPEAPLAEDEDEQTIVVTANRRGGCRVRLADRTLTERQLEANAKKWAAEKTPLRVVRPRGADYNCLAKIVWSLSKHGVKLFHFVHPSEAR